jgi:hypothetical protein
MIREPGSDVDVDGSDVDNEVTHTLVCALVETFFI